MTTETTAKHTPGKWTASEMKDGLKSCGHRVIADGYQLAHCMTFGGVATLAETEANARLIAAAPDLLEALSGIMQGIGNGCECIEGKGHCFYCMAREAIIKAKGR